MWPEHLDESRQLGQVGYVLKMFPRFSETFILTELLALQDCGQPVEIFSLRKPTDGRFHADLARVTSPVSYLDCSAVKAVPFWQQLNQAQHRLPGWAASHQLLLEVAVDEAAQALELAGLVQASGLTHLHAHFASVPARVARIAAALTGIGYSVTTHAKDIFHDEVSQDDLRRVLGDASGVVAISEFNRQHLLTAHPQLQGRLHLVRNGLDLSAFPFHDDLSDRPRRIAAVGRLVEKKGFPDLLRALARLARDGVDVSLDLVGGGDLGHDIACLVEELGLSGRVTLHGAQPQHRVREIVSRAAALVAPCVIAEDGNRDGLPTVLLEAMALGTPCIATPVTGIGEVVRDGQTGLLVPPGDPAGIAGAIERMLDDRTLGARLARAARAEVETHYDSRRQVLRKQALFRGTPAAAGRVAA